MITDKQAADLMFEKVDHAVGVYAKELGVDVRYQFVRSSEPPQVKRYMIRATKISAVEYRRTIGKDPIIRMRGTLFVEVWAPKVIDQAGEQLYAISQNILNELRKPNTTNGVSYFGPVNREQPDSATHFNAVVQATYEYVTKRDMS